MRRLMNQRLLQLVLMTVLKKAYRWWRSISCAICNYFFKEGMRVMQRDISMLLRSLEQEARRCYAEPIGLTENEFIKMMLLDGCFIIEVIRKFDMAFLREKNDPIFEMDWFVNSLQRDLMLFENQLPFFVLCKLFDMIENPNPIEVPINPNRIIRFIHLDLRFFFFFCDLLPGAGHRELVDGNSNEKIKQIKHLLGLIHRSWLPSYLGMEPNGGVPNKKGNWRFIPNTTTLRESGVKLEKAEVVDSLFDITFKRGVMIIPPLTIEGRTESLFRNLIAYEQYCPVNQLSYITDYVGFLDCLIDSPNDVEILCRHGIIDNWFGDDEVVSTLFNKINDSVTRPRNHSHYAEIFNKVNIHCSKRRNHWMTKLRRQYLNSPWAVILILAGFVLLVLTFTETIYSFSSQKLKFCFLLKSFSLTLAIYYSLFHFSFGK